MNLVKSSFGLLLQRARCTQGATLNLVANQYQQFHSSFVNYGTSLKVRDRKELLKTVGKPDDGTDGEKMISLESKIVSREDMFTDENTPDLLFNGVPFKMVPVCSIKVSKNNTHIRLCDYTNKSLALRTCGYEGFKNCRKGTNVAAQSTALWIANKALRIGVKDIRLKIRGLGPGRMASVKGLEMGGLNIISITDDTRISWKPKARARKARRV